MSKFDNAIPIDGGQKIADAMNELYKMYSEDMIDWFAGLYCHEIGGYYYSNSGRDNEGFLPDIESTEQSMRFIDSSGLAGKSRNFATVIPEWMKRDLVRFIKGLQEPNGFFYHPQWSREFTDSKLSRKARDLGNGLRVLTVLGAKPTYDTPTGERGDGLDVDGNPVAHPKKSITAVTADAEQGSADIPEYLKDKESFLGYLGTLDVRNNGYSVGNTLTAIKKQIVFRDQQLIEGGADYSLMKILIDWLNENQNPENGLWCDISNYYGVNGLMKITGVYGAAGVLLPHAETAVKNAIAAMATDEIPNAVTSVYNTWFAAERILRHMRDFGTAEDAIASEKLRCELRKNAPEYLLMTRDKLNIFRKSDSSFSYTPNASSANSQGCPVAIRGTNEGDVNATVICSSDILVYIYASLGIGEYFIPVFEKQHMDRYVELLERGRK